MKFIAALFALVSLNAFAFPNVGDVANYKVSVMGMEFDSKMEIVSYDEASRSYKVVQTTVVMGQTEVQEEMTAADDMMTSAQIDEALGSCEQDGGTLGNVVIAGNTITTCTLSQDGAEFTIGKVPFGIVKFSGVDEGSGMAMTMNLANYRSGK